MESKRKIRAKDIVGDIRSGMANSGLMEKYQLSSKGLQSIFKKLLEANAVRDAELCHRMPLFQDTVDLDQKRQTPRHYLMVQLPVYSSNNLVEEGIVQDISEEGLQIVGLESETGDMKDLLIQADEFADIYPFNFKARCRWSCKDTRTGLPLTGFEIISISDGSLCQLRNLIQVLSLGDRQPLSGSDFH